MKKFLKKDERGFTLAELLIVVAIIGVLVAVSIPIFTTQLEKSRDATSVANIRSAYAEATVAMLTGDADNANVTVNATAAGAGTATVTGVALKGQLAGWSDADVDLPFTHTSMTAAIGGVPGSYSLTFTYTADGGVTLTTIEIPTSGG